MRLEEIHFLSEDGNEKMPLEDEDEIERGNELEYCNEVLI